MVADIMLIYITWTKLSSRDLLKNGIRQSTRPTLAYVCVRDGKCVPLENVEHSLTIHVSAQELCTFCTLHLYTGLTTRPEINGRVLFLLNTLHLLFIVLSESGDCFMYAAVVRHCLIATFSAGGNRCGQDVLRHSLHGPVCYIPRPSTALLADSSIRQLPCLAASPSFSSLASCFNSRRRA